MELMSILLCCTFAHLTLGFGVHSESVLNEPKRKSISDVHSMPEMNTKESTVDVNTFDRVQNTANMRSSSNYRTHCSSCEAKSYDIRENSKKVLEIYPDAKEFRSAKSNFKRNVHSNFSNIEIIEDNKDNKNVRVTKYKTADEKVYAIKVNEINSQKSELNDEKSTCKVYSVKKAYPCETEESNLILMKRKVNKKRILKAKNTTTTQKSMPSVTSASFKKQKVRVESSHVPESFMPSIEELY